jgi:hypothetical protein
LSVEAALPIFGGMSEPARPAADLFDQPPLRQPAAKIGHVGAIAPLTRTRVVDEQGRHVGLRWWTAGVALPAATAVGLVSHFPIWAVAALALFVGARNLWPLPPLARRAWATAAVSFFFAQATSIFVTPFTWPMRFGFCAVLLIGLMLTRVNGGE